ncbi:hypothetical protein B5S33_g4485 [[Candida] boidinii]|nr:hypothetical protein B5S30_g4271 [[Candida] boidinii]OWB85812.1 hypothetical protein B5S33_g4485 [[Candida] boidinii]
MPINSPEIKKIPITPKKAFNLNSNALLWAAVKQKAKSNTTTNHNNTDDSYTQDPLNNTTNTNTATTSNLLTDNELTAFGTNGEVFLVFDKLIELWDWQQPLTRINDTTTYTTGSGSLYLISSVLIDKPGKLLLIQPLVCDRLGLKYKLLIKLNDSFHILDIINNQLTPLEFKSTSPSITIKSGLDFFVISDHTGQLHLFDIHTYKKLEFNSIAKSVNNRTIFDIQGNLLVYNLSPSDTLVKYLKPITSSNKKKPTSDLSLPLTPIKLSRPNTMLQKIWKNLSSNTIDSIYKISEISESKIKNYFYPHQQQQQQQQQPASQSNKKNLLTSENFKILLSTIINTITGESNYISIIDLSTQSPLLIFTPPDGCSHVSLSPHDMLLSTTSSRGDSIFIWDYSNLSNKIILLEKYKRGKTPGIINKLIWSKNNNSIVILSQKSGSIHCFNNNINELGELEINKLKSWILPNFESTDVIIGPKLSILNNTVYKINNKRDLIDLNNKFIDNNSIILSLNKDKKILKIISLSGEINWKFDLPTDYQSDSPELIKPTDIIDPIVELPVLANPIDPLNFAEIQTHEPLRTLYNKRQFEFSTYVHQNTDEEEGKYDSFVSNLNKFDHALQIKIINFGNSKKNSILDSLNTNSNDSLLINNTNNNNYTYNKVHPILDEDANIDIEDDEDIIDIPSSTPDLSRDIIPIEN